MVQPAPLSTMPHANRDNHRKTPWRISAHQKRRQRKRLRLVDNVVNTVNKALTRNGMPLTKSMTWWNEEMPREEEMIPKDKYTIFDKKAKRYRKGIHSMSISILYYLDSAVL